MKTALKRFGVPLGAVLAALLAVGSASAATVAPALDTAGFIIGTGGTTTPFTVSTPGLYKATITDFGTPAADTPSPFATLDFLVSTATSLKGFASAAGSSASFTFDAIPGLTYFASIVGVSSGLVGFYGAEVTLVPIPASAVLLASALVGFAVVGRRRREGEAESAAPAAG